MEIQQKDSETLTAYIHRFKKEAKHCDFNSHPAKIRIFLKGLINSSRITLSVYEKGPTTIEDTIGIVEKISSAQHSSIIFPESSNQHDEERTQLTPYAKPRLFKLWTDRTPMVHLPAHNMRQMQPTWSHLQTLLG